MYVNPTNNSPLEKTKGDEYSSQGQLQLPALSFSQNNNGLSKTKEVTKYHLQTKVWFSIRPQSVRFTNTKTLSTAEHLPGMDVL